MSIYFFLILFIFQNHLSTDDIIAINKPYGLAVQGKFNIKLITVVHSEV